MRCEYKACLHTAESGNKFCLEHGATPAKVAPAPEPEVVTMDSIPRSGRMTQATVKLLKQVRALQSGSALKLRLNHYSVGMLQSVRKCLEDETPAVETGLRICKADELAYIWRLDETEIKSLGQRRARLADARSKRKPKR